MVSRLSDGDLHFELCMRVSELSDAVTLAEQAPDTMLVLDHLGNPPVGDVDLRAWREDLARLADRPNMVCKVSGLMQNTLPDWTEDRMLEIIAHARSCFGVDRLLFGGNWPVCTIAGSLKSWIEIVQRATASWSESERDALFADNAERFYRIDSTA